MKEDSLSKLTFVNACLNTRRPNSYSYVSCPTKYWTYFVYLEHKCVLKLIIAGISTPKGEEQYHIHTNHVQRKQRDPGKDDSRKL